MKEKTMLLYLASPYTSKSRDLQVHRYVEACRIASELIKRGHTVYAPIPFSHPIHELGFMNGDWPAWEDFDKRFLSKCDALLVARLSGWRESVGVTHEIAWAHSLGMPIYGINPHSLVIFDMGEIEVERCVSRIREDA